MDDSPPPKTLRVTIPAHLHIRLRSLKILTGEEMSSTVARALEEYFARREEGEAPQAAANHRD